MPAARGALAPLTFFFVAPATATAAACMPLRSHSAPNLNPWASVLAAKRTTQGSRSLSSPRRIPSERSRKAGQPSQPPSLSQPPTAETPFVATVVAAVAAVVAVVGIPDLICLSRVFLAVRMAAALRGV